MTPDHIAALRLRYATPKPGREDMQAALNEIERLRAEVLESREKARDDSAMIGNERTLSLLLLAERDQLRARVAEVTCPECGVFVGMSDHDMDCETGHALDKKMGIELQWRMKNKAAIQALVDGRAAVVPLGDVNHFYGQDGEDGWKDISEIRLDKPMENN